MLKPETWEEAVFHCAAPAFAAYFEVSEIFFGWKRRIRPVTVREDGAGISWRRDSEEPLWTLNVTDLQFDV